MPTTNGVPSKITKAAEKPVAAKDKVTTNGTSKVNGHIDENGTGAEKIIDVSADWKVIDDDYEKKKIKFNLNWYEKDTEKLDFKIELKKMQRERKK